MSLKSTFLKNECTTQYVFTEEFSMWEIVEYFLLKYPKIYHLDQH